MGGECVYEKLLNLCCCLDRWMKLRETERERDGGRERERETGARGRERERWYRVYTEGEGRRGAERKRERRQILRSQGQRSRNISILCGVFILILAIVEL